MKLTGYQMGKSDVENAIANEWSGHPVGVQFRQKWNRRKWGDLKEWRQRFLTITDDHQQDTSSDKASVILSVTESVVETKPSTEVAGLWESKHYLIAASGEVEFTSSHLSKVKSSGPIKLYWSHIAPGQEMNFTGTDDERNAKWKEIVMKAVESAWNFAEFGPVTDYALKSFSFQSAPLFTAHLKKVDCSGTPKPTNSLLGVLVAR
jgi:hypothetical protein